MTMNIDDVVITCCDDKCGIAFAVPAWWHRGGSIARTAIGRSSASKARLRNCAASAMSPSSNSPGPSRKQWMLLLWPLATKESQET